MNGMHVVLASQGFNQSASPADPCGCALLRGDFHDHAVLSKLVQSPIRLAAVLSNARDRVRQLDAALPRLA